MKTKYLFVMIIGFLLGLYGCYEDKGNYDYTAIFSVEVEGLEESYLKYAFIDSLNIDPVITPVDAEYDCFWGYYPVGLVEKPQLDTICHTRELHYRVDLNAGEYMLVFGAREKETGISRFASAPLAVETSLTTGWYVLKDREGYTDYDVFTEKGKAADVIAGSNEGRKLKGEAVALAFTTLYCVWNEEKEDYFNTIAVMACSSEDMAAIKVSDGKIKNDFQNLFYEMPAVTAPQSCWADRRAIYLINNGQMYALPTITSNSGRFGEAMAGDYKFSLYFVNFGRFNPLLFDELSHSFCSMDSYNNTLLKLSNSGPVDTIKLPPVNEMEADLLFMGPQGRYGQGRAWALMKNRQEELYSMLKLNADCNTPYKNPILQCDTLENDLGILEADCRATNLDNDIIYFSKGNRIYSCNINAGYAEKLQVEIPDGEEVTWMRHVQGPSTLNINCMAVATYKAGKYKVYFYDIQAGNLRASGEPLEGDGRVGSVMYIKGSNSTFLY